MSSNAYPAASSGSDASGGANASSGKGGAFGPHPSRVWAGAALLAVAAIAAVVVLLTSVSGGAASRRAAIDSKYGSYPTWLKHTKLPSVDTVLKASLAHPQLDAVEGNTMEVTLPSGGDAEITAVGPSFPAWVAAATQAGTLPEGTAVPTTFAVTVIARHGAVPLRASAFSILTAAGQILQPAVTASGGQAPPTTLRAGEHVNLTIKAKLTEGDGSLRWAPIGSRVISGWLYQVELD